MPTIVQQVRALSPEAEIIAQAGALLRGGGLVVFPTETVYGLGANALDAAAVARIFAAKGRPAHNPVIVHIAESAEVTRVVRTWPELAERLAAKFWPGPLTLVLPKNPAVPDIVTAGGPTVAVRLPAHPVALAVIRAAGVPIAAPSANRSTQLSPTRAEHVLHDLQGRIDLLLDAGPTPGGLESTVLDLTTTPPRLLRPGLATLAEIEAVIGPIARPTLQAAPEQAPLPSPGMLARHYAPRAVLECVPDSGMARVDALRRQGMSVGWVTFDSSSPHPEPNVRTVLLPRDPEAYAAQLYAVLHDLDAAGVDRIIVAGPPETDEWLAIRDRLSRASAAPEIPPS